MATLVNRRSFDHNIYDAPTSHRRERRRVQYNYSNGSPKYIAYHPKRNAAETDTDWEIIKYTSDVLKDDGPIQGAVNTEAVINALSWNV